MRTTGDDEPQASTAHVRNITQMAAAQSRKTTQSKTVKHVFSVHTPPGQFVTPVLQRHAAITMVADRTAVAIGVGKRRFYPTRVRSSWG